MAIYLANADYLHPETFEITRTGINVHDGPDGGIEFSDTPLHGASELDCAGWIVTKSFVVGHHHIYSALACGMPPPPSPPTNFVEILEKIWWRLDKALDEDMIRASALAAGIHAAKSGTTFIIDHHASPNAPTDALHIIADALDRVGLSHLLCYELSDRDGPDRLQKGLDETARYLASNQGLVGLHASFTVGDDLLERAMGLARDHKTGIHVHVAEAESDQQHCLANYHRRVVQRFADVGALELPQTILAHCIHLDDAERQLIASSQAWVAQQSESNQNNGVGHLDASAFPDRTFIGTDGMSGDAVGSTRAAYLASQRHDALTPRDAHDRLRRAHRYLKQNGFTGDSDNNLVVLDYTPPTPITTSNWPGHVMYGFNRSHVHSVISNGRIIVRDRHCQLVDEDEVMTEAQRQAQRLWDRLR